MSLQNRPVLIIDDDPDMRILMRKIFETSGMTVFEAEGVQQGLLMVQKAQPHLVILDLQMPGESGIEFFQLRAAVPSLKGIPVIVVSAVTERATVYSAIVAGASDYLIKPFSSALLIQKVRKALKDTEYKTVYFEKDQRPKGSFTVPGEISKVSETSFFLETSAKLAPASQIRVSSETFTHAEVVDCVFTTGPAAPVKSIDGQYVSTVRVAGLRETLTKKLNRVKGQTS